MVARLSPDIFRHALREPRSLFARRETCSAFFTGGGLLAAMAASACCVLPLALGALGLGGAWLSSLTLVAPYRTPIRIFAILLLSAGLWLVYASKPASEGAACVRNPSQRLTKALLWLGVFVMIVVLSADGWVPLVT